MNFDEEFRKRLLASPHNRMNWPLPPGLEHAIDKACDDHYNECVEKQNAAIRTKAE